MNQTPVPPANQETLLAPSAEFEKEAIQPVVVIVGFILVYFILFLLLLALAALCFYGGIAILGAKISFFTIVLSVGIMGWGVMIFVFLVKFLSLPAKPIIATALKLQSRISRCCFKGFMPWPKKSAPQNRKRFFSVPM